MLAPHRYLDKFCRAARQVRQLRRTNALLLDGLMQICGRDLSFCHQSCVLASKCCASDPQDCVEAYKHFAETILSVYERSRTASKEAKP